MSITYSMSTPSEVGCMSVPSKINSTMEAVEWFLKVIELMYGPNRRMISFEIHFETGNND